jgi:hypothetical protein
MMTNNKIKVLHIIEALGGGVYSYFIDLTSVMGQDERFELYVAYSDKRDEIDPAKVRGNLHKNTNLILIDLTKEISPINDLRGINQIKGVIRDINPDIVHLHSSKAGILGKIALFQINFNKPTYYTPHGYSFLRQDVSKAKKWLYKSIELFFTKFSSTITVACGYSELECALKMNPNARLIKNGVNTSIIKFKENTKKPSSLTFGTLGRISFQKNPQLFNEFAKRSHNHSFLWIGDGDMRQEITSNNIKVTGWFKKKAAAISYLDQLDVYVQTSLWEGLPIAVIEAMAIGLPVIATNVIGNKDLVKHGETGFLVDTADEFEVHATALESHELRRSMGRAGRLRVEAFFDCNKNFKSQADMYVLDHSSNN